MLAPRFLNGPRGRLLALGHVPDTDPRPPHWVLAVPPFFEELNKSRRTLALLGQALARHGIGCLLVDLFGTGDSEGDLREATWEDWIENLSRARDWLAAAGAVRTDVLGVRGGALLAWDWLALARPDCGRLLLWQPVTAGRQLASHLLRLRLAGGLMGTGNTETAADLRERLARDGWIEIAGYSIPAGLMSALEGAALADPAGRRLAGIDWYQMVSPPALTLPPAAAACAAALSAAGLPTETIAVPGDAFWATQEIVEGHALVEATLLRLLPTAGTRA